jgi:CDP-diglyceride synthetase
MLLALAFISYSLPPYLTLDPTRSRIVPPAGVPGYYALLVAHVIFGSVAMIAACLQVWPWLRRERPVVHRRLGVVYVLGGVVPAGLMGLTIGAVSPFGPVISASNVVLAIVWLTVTITGFRAGRRHSWVEHRRWMIRSVVLTFSVITNRVWTVVWVIVLIPQLNTTFGGNERLMIQTIAGLSGWLGWVIPLVVTEWRLEPGALRTLGRDANPDRSAGPGRLNQRPAASN